jgi:hypothetical protein
VSFRKTFFLIILFLSSGPNASGIQELCSKAGGKLENREGGCYCPLVKLYINPQLEVCIAQKSITKLRKIFNLKCSNFTAENNKAPSYKTFSRDKFCQAPHHFICDSQYNPMLKKLSVSGLNEEMTNKVKAIEEYKSLKESFEKICLNRPKSSKCEEAENKRRDFGIKKLNEMIYSKDRKEKLKKIIERVANKIRKKSMEYSKKIINKDEREDFLDGIDDLLEADIIHLEGEKGVSYNSAGYGGGVFSDNLRIGTTILLADTNPKALMGIIAHEYGHGIFKHDHDGYTHSGKQKFVNSFKNEPKKQQRGNNFSKIYECLSGKDSIGARVNTKELIACAKKMRDLLNQNGHEDLASDMDDEIFVMKTYRFYGTSNVAILRKLPKKERSMYPQCGDAQSNECFSDWFSTEVMSEILIEDTPPPEVFPKKMRLDESYFSLNSINMMSFYCVSVTDDSKTEKLGSHARGQDRINEIFSINPDIQKGFGCTNQSSKKWCTY